MGVGILWITGCESFCHLDGRSGNFVDLSYMAVTWLRTMGMDIGDVPRGSGVWITRVAAEVGCDTRTVRRWLVDPKGVSSMTAYALSAAVDRTVAKAAE